MRALLSRGLMLHASNVRGCTAIQLYRHKPGHESRRIPKIQFSPDNNSQNSIVRLSF